MNVRTILCFFLGLCGSACAEVVERPNRDHCTLNDGDRYCAEMFEGLPYCTQGEYECSSEERYGCVAEVAAECHRPCGALNMDECLGASTGTGTSTGSESGSSESSGSESSSTTGPMPCVSDEECTDAEAPFCGVSGECGTCSGTTDPDAACAGVDPGLPLCVGDTCVACTPENPVVCDEQLLLCDGTTNACVPCTEHTQCGSGACELAVGTCFPEDVVVHVDGDGGQDFLTVAAAVASVGAGTHGVIVVHAQDSGLEYPNVLIDGDKRIALLAAAGEEPIIQGTGGAPGLLVEGAGTILYIDGLRVALSPGVGLRVNDALAWVDRSHIVQNSGGGVLAENAAELVLRNCFVGGGTEAIGIEVIDSTATVLYTTATANTFMATPAFGCTNPVAVDIRNTIVVSQGGASPDELSCAGATVTNSATEATVGGFDLAWFVNYNGGDFSLSASGATIFADVALWSTGDPLTDIDGDPRPAVDATPDYAGADVPL